MDLLKALESAGACETGIATALKHLDVLQPLYEEILGSEAVCLRDLQRDLPESLQAEVLWLPGRLFPWSKVVPGVRGIRAEGGGWRVEREDLSYHTFGEILSYAFDVNQARLKNVALQDIRLGAGASLVRSVLEDFWVEGFRSRSGLRLQQSTQIRGHYRIVEASAFQVFRSQVYATTFEAVDAGGFWAVQSVFEGCVFRDLDCQKVLFEHCVLRDCEFIEVEPEFKDCERA
ncbi:MAG: hypothetical protein D6812_00280 [Deltaproteobacteria bacterium]|nr:MAG: hypothetical protein D6812_00280 [Deltaproteobacteria bacterium]